MGREGGAVQDKVNRVLGLSVTQFSDGLVGCCVVSPALKPQGIRPSGCCNQPAWCGSLF